MGKVKYFPLLVSGVEKEKKIREKDWIWVTWFSFHLIVATNIGSGGGRSHPFKDRYKQL